jgi:hypothetical protein
MAKRCVRISIKPRKTNKASITQSITDCVIFDTVSKISTTVQMQWVKSF